eukprot:456835-Pleurochrysis_carterae.AAC.1
MMMVGHTHENIDALFRRVAEYWSRKGMVLTPYDFFAFLRASVESTTVHPLVEYVHGYAGFFSDCIYDDGINKASGSSSSRSALMADCADAARVLCATAVEFWYKPDSSHKHLYPTEKNEEGNPKTGYDQWREVSEK